VSNWPVTLEPVINGYLPMLYVPVESPYNEYVPARLTGPVDVILVASPLAHSLPIKPPLAPCV
jgi:hypothetical protein